MKIYADILICENFIVNLFLLAVTMRIIKHRCSTKRLLISSVIGSVYTLVLFIPDLELLSSFFSRIIVLILMIRISYGRSNVITMVKTVGVFLMITFTLSGLCFALSFNQNSYKIGGDFEISNYSIKYLLLAIMAVYISYERISSYIKDRHIVDNYNYLIEFENNGSKYSIRTFLDTGNELREPITNLPCILIEEELISNINFDDKNTYYIPYSSVGFSGSLKGMRINGISIKTSKSYKKVDAIICPCKEKLSKENEFNGLLSRGIL